MDVFRAIGIVEGFEDAESEEQVLEAWQFLVDSRIVFSLQGSLGRQAADMINAGILHME